MEKIKSSVVAFCLSSPFTCVCMRRTFGSCALGTAMGPCQSRISSYVLDRYDTSYLPWDRMYLEICQCKIVCDHAVAHARSCH
jgi:hypothetical protein